MEIRSKENLVGTRIAPTAISRTFAPLLGEPGFISKDSLLPLRIRWDVGRRWDRGSNRGPDARCSAHNVSTPNMTG